MSMNAQRGLEMVCITRHGNFDLTYAGSGSYVDPKGEEIKDLMDMGCLGCGAAYFTTEAGFIDFCPACGYMERKRFESFQDLQGWSNAQHWGFLKRNGHNAFGVERGGEWRLAFAQDRIAIEATGQFSEIRNLLG